jgi:hypothetical protein
VLNPAAVEQLGLALERVQGTDRQFLRSAKTADLTFDRAQQIASMPVKGDKVVATK